MDETKLIGVVDLGSNSFHLSIVQEDHGRLVVVDRLKDMVQLACGLTPEHMIEEQVRKRAMSCLLRFGERLSGLKKENIRAVGTNTLRRLKDKRFLIEAEKCLGTGIDIVSGREEARLIYLGVSQYIDFIQDELFVIDIGGGSTELIIGNRDALSFAVSSDIGCVFITRQFFPDFKITRDNVSHARLYIERELLPLRHSFEVGSRQVVGSSGTIKTVREALIQEGINEDEITREGLDKLLKRFIALRTPKEIAHRFGMSPERAQVICGGLIILQVAFETFGLESMQVADTAMREGIILDLLGRIRKEDMRDCTIESIMFRFGANADQVRRVEHTALKMAKAIKNKKRSTTAPLRYLSWAARLHEIGLAISHHRYFRHGAYLIEHADLDGFSRQDQKIIATIIANHKRKLAISDFEYLPDFVFQLTIILRLAVLLHRSRGAYEVPDFDFSIHKHTIALKFPAGWLEARPLINEDLKNEAKWLHQSRLTLTWE